MAGKFAAAAGLVVAMSCSGPAHRPKAEPADPNVIAVVLGRRISAAEKDKLNELIFGALLEKYASDNKIAPTDDELDVFVRRMEKLENQQQAELEKDREKLQQELKSSSLSDRDRKDKESRLQTVENILKSTREMKEQTQGMEDQTRTLKRQMAQHFVKTWKVNKALYGRYGGRIIFQQAGVEPLDAYREFLRDQEKNGSFQIIDKQYEASFWRYFTDDAMHTFYTKDDGAKFINTPFWMTEELPQK